MSGRLLLLGLLFVFSCAVHAQTTTPALPGLPSPDELRRSIEKVRSLAEKGDANAQFLVGQYLELIEPYSGGKPRTIEEHRKWSEGLRKSVEEARKWYELAAKQGHVAGSYALIKANGVAHPTGKRRLLLYAAEKGHVGAMDALSESYRYTYKMTEYRIDRDYPQDFGQAVLWKTRAAERGHAQAKEDLAIWYWKGLMGLRADYQKTRELLLEAAKLGLCSAMLNVGGLYFNGDGVSQSASEAQSWFAKAKQCDGNNAAMIKHADKYAEQAKAGDLPKLQAEGAGAAARTSPQASWQQDAFVKGFWRGVALAAVLTLVAGGSQASSLDDPFPQCEFGEVPYPFNTGALGIGMVVQGNFGRPCMVL
jgi:TPR repeat protein